MTNSAGIQADELLHITGVRKSFGPVVALKNAQFSLKKDLFMLYVAAMAQVNRPFKYPNGVHSA